MKRRPTWQVRKLLDTAQDSYLSIMKSQRYCEASLAKNRNKLLQNIREIEIAWFSVVATLRWVLGEGLTAIERQHTLTELESEFEEPNEGD